MFIHMFSFRWKLGVTEQQKQRVLSEVGALQNKIPGILDQVSTSLLALKATSLAVS